ncbi:MAG: hypothetical protein FWH00_00335 [Oscillospiraceae bacterium]|nr:hypothetical protein [Oscillospiraceae bacterium]
MADNTDFKAMYYHLAGRMAGAIETLEATTEILEATTQSMAATAKSLSDMKDKLKLSMQNTENIFINSDSEYTETPQ